MRGHMMKKMLFKAATLLLMTLTSFAVVAKSELQTYAEQCESELGFSASDVKPMNCGDGDLFALGTLEKFGEKFVSDYFIYQRVNNGVDLTVACRWAGRTLAFGVDLIIHNRLNAKTCFFSAKKTVGYSNTDPRDRLISTAIVSPTNFSTMHSADNPNADDYWMQPTDLNNQQLPSDKNLGVYAEDANGNSSFPDDIMGNANLPVEGIDSARCVGCHVAGPYIASSRIASFLAKYGLLNDGHDTVADFTASKHYHAVGSNRYDDPISGSNAFKSWDYFIAKNIVLQQNGCSNGCHSIADNSTIGTLMPESSPPVIAVSLLPSIYADIAYTRQAGNIMEPLDPYSDYRWMNHSNAGGTGDWELLKDEAKYFPRLYGTCQNPTRLEAHVVGSDNIFATDDLPDTLRTFNLRDGLVCINADQPGGKCHDYSTQYLCKMPVAGSDFWTDWINNDNTDGHGDYERRTDPAYANLCLTYDPKTLRPVVGTPIAMRATTSETIPPFRQITWTGYAPNDRLEAFDPSYGLACVNSDQPDGHCSNYVVRFECTN